MDEESANNYAIFNSALVVTRYLNDHDLTPCERILVDQYFPPGLRILDIGIGTGRTTGFLAPQAARYVGIDYAPAMIDAARARFPKADLRVADAMDLNMFTDGSFDAVMFAFNGLDYLHPLDRRTRALVEFHRVLVPGGALVFSTHNARAFLRGPRPGEVENGGLSRAWAAAARRSVRVAANSFRQRPLWRGHGYGIDPFRPLVTYFATPARVTEDLETLGFEVEQVIGSDAPRRSRSWMTPCFYYACTRRE